MGTVFLPLHGLSLIHSACNTPNSNDHVDPAGIPRQNGKRSVSRSSAFKTEPSERVLTVARTWHSRKSACSVRYAKSRGKRPTAENCAFGLRDGRPLTHLQKAVRSDLPASQKSGMVGTARFELATSRTPSVRATRLRYVPTGVQGMI